MAKRAVGIGLICHPAIQWLVTSEPPVHNYIGDFILDRAPSDKVEVAGPPTREMAKRIAKGGDIELPTVTLMLSKEDTINGPAIRVTASDDDIATVQAWMLRQQHGEIAFS